jgi:hypothetical protein
MLKLQNHLNRQILIFKIMKKFSFMVSVLILLGFGCSGVKDEQNTAMLENVDIADWSNGVYSVVADESVIKWIGRGVGKQHDGEVDFGLGVLTIGQDGPTGGEFVADMATIRSLDVQNETLRRALDDHLRSDDFFAVATYPEARLLIKEINQMNDGKFSLVVDMTLKGVTREILIEGANISQVQENEVWAEAFFSIDRTEFNVRYGSGKFFQNLGNSLIEDKIDFKVEAKFRR